MPSMGIYLGGRIIATYATAGRIMRPAEKGKEHFQEAMERLGTLELPPLPEGVEVQWAPKDEPDFWAPDRRLFIIEVPYGTNFTVPLPEEGVDPRTSFAIGEFIKAFNALVESTFKSVKLPEWVAVGICVINDLQYTFTAGAWRDAGS
jgi:hypothetical protein